MKPATRPKIKVESNMKPKQQHEKLEEKIKHEISDNNEKNPLCKENHNNNNNDKDTMTFLSVEADEIIAITKAPVQKEEMDASSFTMEMSTAEKKMMDSSSSVSSLAPSSASSVETNIGKNQSLSPLSRNTNDCKSHGSSTNETIKDKNMIQTNGSNEGTSYVSAKHENDDAAASAAYADTSNNDTATNGGSSSLVGTVCSTTDSSFDQGSIFPRNCHSISSSSCIPSLLLSNNQSINETPTIKLDYKCNASDNTVMQPPTADQEQSIQYIQNRQDGQDNKVEQLATIAYNNHMKQEQNLEASQETNVHATSKTTTDIYSIKINDARTCIHKKEKVEEEDSRTIVMDDKFSNSSISNDESSKKEISALHDNWHDDGSETKDTDHIIDTDVFEFNEEDEEMIPSKNDKLLIQSLKQEKDEEDSFNNDEDSDDDKFDHGSNIGPKQIRNQTKRDDLAQAAAAAPWSFEHIVTVDKESDAKKAATSQKVSCSLIVPNDENDIAKNTIYEQQKQEENMKNISTNQSIKAEIPSLSAGTINCPTNNEDNHKNDDETTNNHSICTKNENDTAVSVKENNNKIITTTPSSTENLATAEPKKKKKRVSFAPTLTTYSFIKPIIRNTTNSTISTKPNIKIGLLHSSAYTKLLHSTMSFIHQDRDVLLHSLLHYCGFLVDTPNCFFVNTPNKIASRDILEIFHYGDYLNLLEYPAPNLFSSCTSSPQSSMLDAWQQKEEEEEVYDAKRMKLLDRHGLTDDCPIPTNSQSKYLLWKYCQSVVGTSIQASDLLKEKSLSRLSNKETGRRRKRRKEKDDGMDVAVHWGGGRHHAHSGKAGGFCYVNDVVLAILNLVQGLSNDARSIVSPIGVNGSNGNDGDDEGAYDDEKKRFCNDDSNNQNNKNSQSKDNNEHPKKKRVLYMDIDIHHPDGVQSAFYGTDQVLTVSFHRHEAGFFPSQSGSIREKGRHGTPGVGYNINFPLYKGCDNMTFCAVFRYTLYELVEVYDPHYVVLCVGADGVYGDNLVGEGDGWNLTPEGLAECVRIASELCGGSGERGDDIDVNDDVVDKDNKTEDGGITPTKFDLSLSCESKPGQRSSKKRKRKLLLFGGGGYNPTNTARTFLLCTAAACEGARPGMLWKELPTDVPRHSYFPRYGPHFELVSSSVKEELLGNNRNDVKLISKLKEMKNDVYVDANQKMLVDGIKTVDMACLFIRGRNENRTKEEKDICTIKDRFMESITDECFSFGNKKRDPNEKPRGRRRRRKKAKQETQPPSSSQGEHKIFLNNDF